MTRQGLGFRLTILGNQGAPADLERIAARASNPEPMFRAMYAVFLAEERHQFDTFGAAGGTPWKPASPAWVAYKARHGLDTRTLRATTALYQSLTTPGQPGAVYRTTRTTLEMGTSIPYARYHQDGTRWLPPRPPIAPHNRRLQERLVGVAKDWITGGST